MHQESQWQIPQRWPIFRPGQQDYKTNRARQAGRAHWAHRANHCCRALAAVCLVGLGAVANAQVPVLGVDTPFAQPGTSLQFSISGEPGASWSLFLSAQPAEVPFGAQGTLFLKPGSIIPLGGGVLDAAGQGSRILAIPAALATGRVFYSQVRVSGAAATFFSNAVPFRIEATPPSGPRVTMAVAATPDGRRVYVAHQLDGSVSVVDPVTAQKIAELPVTPSAAGIPFRPLDIAVDPEGRHAFVVNAAADRIAVIHTATDSIAAQIPVPRGSRRVAFDFSRQKRVYVSNETANAILELRESPSGTFTLFRTIPLQGGAPGPVLALADGRLVVGLRAPHSLEWLDPDAAPGSQTLATTLLEGLPFDLIASGTEVLVPSFVLSGMVGIEGFNRVLRVDQATQQLLGARFEDVATDYVDAASGGGVLAIVAASTGTLLLADDATGTVLDHIELAPGLTATPQTAAYLPAAGGAAARFYVANYFRETLRPVRVDAGPVFVAEAEIPLAWAGQPRVPLSGTLSPEEDGDWFFRSVNLFGASAFSPNRATCFSCHVDGGADNLPRNRQVPPAWGLGSTAPYGWNGGGNSLLGLIQGAMNSHNSSGMPNFPGADLLVQSYLQALQPPPSIYRNMDGSLSADAQAGKALFEGVAQCSGCHAAPVFIPPAGNDPNIPAGIGTGLVPANVPSLRGLWATAPYLHNGSAATLLEVLTLNPADTHAQLAGPLSAAEREQLIDYLLSL